MCFVMMGSWVRVPQAAPPSLWPFQKAIPLHPRQSALTCVSHLGKAWDVKPIVNYQATTLADKLTPAQRSAHMAKIRRANTRPEWVVRRSLFAMGYRYRLQWRAAPGRPDIAFPGRRKAIFVHGCFWHQHEGCFLSHVPSTRREFWQSKFDRNRARDARDLKLAKDTGWDALVVWECETRDRCGLEERLIKFLGPSKL